SPRVTAPAAAHRPSQEKSPGQDCHTRCRFQSHRPSDDCAWTGRRQTTPSVALTAGQVQAAEQTIDMHTLAYLTKAQSGVHGQCRWVGTADQCPSPGETPIPVVCPYPVQHQQRQPSGAIGLCHLPGELVDTLMQHTHPAAVEMIIVVVPVADPDHTGSMPLAIKVGEACHPLPLQQI